MITWLKIPTHIKHSATLPHEILVSSRGINFCQNLVGSHFVPLLPPFTHDFPSPFFTPVPSFSHSWLIPFPFPSSSSREDVCEYLWSWEKVVLPVRLLRPSDTSPWYRQTDTNDLSSMDVHPNTNIIQYTDLSALLPSGLRPRWNLNRGRGQGRGEGQGRGPGQGRGQGQGRNPGSKQAPYCKWRINWWSPW